MVDDTELDIPGEEDVLDIVKYLQEHSGDMQAIPNLMKKYNCSQKSIMNIVMNGGN